MSIIVDVGQTCKACANYREVTFEKMYCEEVNKFFESVIYICKSFEERSK